MLSAICDNCGLSESYEPYDCPIRWTAIDIVLRTDRGKHLVLLCDECAHSVHLFGLKDIRELTPAQLIQKLYSLLCKEPD